MVIDNELIYIKHNVCNCKYVAEVRVGEGGY